jgi:CBS domain-containing protein
METRDRFQDDTNDDDTLMIGGARPVLEFVSDDVTTLLPTTSLREAAVALRRDDVSFAAVGVGAAIEGVISERDLVDAIAMGLDIDETAIEIVESDSLKWATATSTVDDVAEEMLETYVRHILVCNEDGTLAGVVSMRDLLTAYRV